MLAIRGNDFEPPVKVLYERGAKLIAGTDAGINNIPHHAYVGGLEAMATVGVPVEEVLYAATVRAAEALGLGDVTGRLAEGLTADVIAVEGDPSTDLAALHELRFVMTRGEPFTPDPDRAVLARPGDGEGAGGDVPRHARLRPRPSLTVTRHRQELQPVAVGVLDDRDPHAGPDVARRDDDPPAGLARSGP